MCNFKIIKNDNGNTQCMELTLVFSFIHSSYMDLESIILGHYDVLHTTTASMKKFFGKVYKNRVDILNRILKISVEQSMMPEARYHFLKFLCIILITKANDQIIVNEPKI